MNWIFSSQYSTKETKTGFSIHLLGGSWREPMDIKPRAPKGMTTPEQARLLRLGLAFASEVVDHETPKVGGGLETLEKAT